MNMNPSIPQVEAYQNYLPIEERLNLISEHLRKAKTMKDFISLLKPWPGMESDDLRKLGKFCVKKFDDFRKFRPTLDQINEYKVVHPLVEFNIAIMERAVEHIQNKDEFETLLKPGVPNPSKHYVLALERFKSTHSTKFVSNPQ
jgi:hypothetical protein